MRKIPATSKWFRFMVPIVALTLVLKPSIQTRGEVSPVVSVAITSPAAESEVSGTITFTASAPSSATVDYWIAGHSIVIGELPTSAPFTAKVDTKPLWDGLVQVVAVARDSGDNITGQSRPVTLNISNGRATKVKQIAPNFSKPLSGTIAWTVSANDDREIEAFIYFVDGGPQGSATHYIGRP